MIRKHLLSTVALEAGNLACQPQVNTEYSWVTIWKFARMAVPGFS